MTENPDLEKMLKNIPSEKDRGPTSEERIGDLEEEIERLKKDYVPRDSITQTYISQEPKREREPIDIPVKKIIGYGLYAAATAGIAYVSDSFVWTAISMAGSLIGSFSSFEEHGGDSKAGYFFNGAILGALASMAFQLIMPFESLLNNSNQTGAITYPVPIIGVGVLGGYFSHILNPITDFLFEE